ncbi:MULTISPECIES: DUF3352 domain-containing protein [Desulfosediminicola]|uniref:DUF3352 domain-containing protein n=1 Tax=Desulfosediminicola TaxID=2886823 RepID=UPI0010AD77A9|nr:DUF3352 domain-containing protein [Desulfosediminicola ganghwensis]
MRIVLSVLVSTLMVLGIFLVSRIEIHELETTQFLPVDTLIYAEQVDGVESMKRFFNSRFGKALDSIDYEKVLSEGGFNNQYQAEIRKVLEGVDRLRTDPLVQHILGEKCSVAFVPQRNWSNHDDSLDLFVRHHTLLISKPDLPQLSLAKLLTFYGGTFDNTSVMYGKHTINRMVLENYTLYISVVEGYVLASFEERIIRESLDIFDEQSVNLGTDPDFLAHRTKLGEAERFLYIAIDGLQELAQYGASRSADERAKAVLHEMSTLRGITTLSYGTWRDKDISNDKILAKINQEAMDIQVREMISTRPSINDTLSLVGDNVLLYYWSNTLNPRLLWNMFVAEAGETDADIESIRFEIKNSTGYEVEQIIDMADSSVSILLKPSLRAQFIPIPDTALMIRLRDEESVNALIQESLNQLDIHLQSRKYKDVQYYVWGIYDRESLQPVYTIYRGYLIIANTMDMLRAILDTPLTESQLVAAESFERLDPGFQKLNNSVFYVDQATLALHLEKIVSWLSTIIAVQDRQAAIHARVITDNLISPILHGLAMYEKSATRTSLDGDTIIIESKTKIRE